MSTYEALWPSAPLGVQAHRAAPRLDHLAGRRVALLWDYLFRGDEVFPVLTDELERRYSGIEILPYDVIGNTHGGDEVAVIEALPQNLRDRGVDAVVSGMGC